MSGTSTPGGSFNRELYDVTVIEFECLGWECVVKRVKDPYFENKDVTDNRNFCAYARVPEEIDISTIEWGDVESKNNKEITHRPTEGKRWFGIDDRAGELIPAEQFRIGVEYDVDAHEDRVREELESVIKDVQRRVIEERSGVYWWPEWVEGVEE